MANLVPETIKNGASRLREDLHRALDRWFHRHHQDADGIEVQDRDDELVIEAAMPGMDPKDVSVEIRDDRLILRGEKRIANEQKGKGYYYTEHSVGSFAEVIPLPFEVDAKRAKAKYHHGLLQVVLPKSEAAKQREVKVRVT